ncbi:hypothetical protein DPEC_G00337030 [Dallia pectoralis]|uniref:Uncharacterized protein n=1 Tax=Dallia pectoralis TaxID=75939 RepID=A0ACC2F7E9_DALPE|nr:hypothetical protein DPEC_G00337030 [Dallia pectoralis]
MWPNGHKRDQQASHWDDRVRVIASEALMFCPWGTDWSALTSGTYLRIIGSPAQGSGQTHFTSGPVGSGLFCAVCVLGEKDSEERLSAQVSQTQTQFLHVLILLGRGATTVQCSEAQIALM